MYSLRDEIVIQLSTVLIRTDILNPVVLHAIVTTTTTTEKKTR